MMGSPFQKAPARAHGLGNAPSAAHYRGWHTANVHPHGAGPMPPTSHPTTSGGAALPAGSMGTMQSGGSAPGYSPPGVIGGGAANPMGGGPSLTPGMIGGSAVNPMSGPGGMPHMDQGGTVDLCKQNPDGPGCKTGDFVPDIRGPNEPLKGYFEDGGEVPGQEYAPPAPAGAGGGGQQMDMSQSQSHETGTSALPTPNLPTHAAQQPQQEDASGGPAAKRQVLDNALDMVQRVYKYRQGKHGLRGGGGTLTQQPSAGQMDPQFGGGGKVGACDPKFGQACANTHDASNQEDFNMPQQLAPTTNAGASGPMDDASFAASSGAGSSSGSSSGEGGSDTFGSDPGQHGGGGGGEGGGKS